MLKIDELDEWRSHVKEKPRIHNAKLKRLHDELKDERNHFKVGDQVLLDETVLKCFPYGTVERERGVSTLPTTVTCKSEVSRA
ncbi:hypothetical protein GOBAR_AA34088 [Gossypium barbadense]|uniref:Uncharacterized protein n=1 Tax=Gossypium barbadense TaxID=3634 RepID=A0A2P5W693_GOSBA|nr:hypothetical protein GOBAR_AA34088 [Gossypium barbadense]